MNLELSKKQLFILVIAFLIIGLLTVGAYFLYIVPTNNSLDEKKSELKMTNQELSIIQNKLKQTSDQTLESTMGLQMQVPVKRLLDQLLLDIEKAEIISDTNIIELQLVGSENDEEILTSTEKALNEAQQTNENTTKTNTEADETLPNGMKKTTLLLSGEAKTYFEMEKFLSELESLVRIVKIDQFKFKGREEIYTTEQSLDPIKFEVTISAFYFPSLMDLQKELPPLDIPEVSNKSNPTSEFSEVEGISENDKNTNP